MIHIKINTQNRTVELLEETSIRQLGEIQKIIKSLDPKKYHKWTITQSSVPYYGWRYTSGTTAISPSVTYTNTDVPPENVSTNTLNIDSLVNDNENSFNDEDISRN